MAHCGIDVVLYCYSNASQAEKTAEQIRALGVNCVTLQASLLDHDRAQTLVKRARDGLSKDLDDLIN